MEEIKNSNKIQKKIGRGPAEQTKERREKLLKVIQEVGYWNINKTKLAEMFGVSQR